MTANNQAGCNEHHILYYELAVGSQNKRNLLEKEVAWSKTQSRERSREVDAH